MQVSQGFCGPCCCWWAFWVRRRLPRIARCNLPLLTACLAMSRSWQHASVKCSLQETWACKGLAGPSTLQWLSHHQAQRMAIIRWQGTAGAAAIPAREGAASCTWPGDAPYSPHLAVHERQACAGAAASTARRKAGRPGKRVLESSEEEDAGSGASGERPSAQRMRIHKRAEAQGGGPMKLSQDHKG